MRRLRSSTCGVTPGGVPARCQRSANSPQEVPLRPTTVNNLQQPSERVSAVQAMFSDRDQR